MLAPTVTQGRLDLAPFYAPANSITGPGAPRTGKEKWPPPLKLYCELKHGELLQIRLSFHFNKGTLQPAGTLEDSSGADTWI